MKSEPRMNLSDDLRHTSAISFTPEQDNTETIIVITQESKNSSLIYSRRESIKYGILCILLCVAFVGGIILVITTY